MRKDVEGTTVAPNIAILNYSIGSSEHIKVRMCGVGLELLRPEEAAEVKRYIMQTAASMDMMLSIE